MNSCWKLAEGTLNKNPITIHFRDDLENFRTDDEYDQCLQVAWYAKDVDEQSRYPTQDEMIKIDRFNLKLNEALEGNYNSVLTMVITSDGVTQWVFYTRDVEDVGHKLNTISTEAGLYPIEVVADPDPAWSTFDKIYQAINH